ncbi:hypothetical protein GCM10007857_77730 [Bradyrhizobium iriomotense]|uniref:Uncharacterized protein n=1 Tax=Bradyrhizobium iriomotense TaxID=441950 RepID=A0ABQ6B9I7_9BRAD|nr:hypothetical protein GCM10007857_77730 [Bradyrhizobium iriomotense]
MQGLREDDAIERTLGQSPWDRDVTNNGDDGVGGVDMENIAFLNPVASELERVLVVADFKDSAANPGGMTG